jgi:hypothetical protein
MVKQTIPAEALWFCAGIEFQPQDQEATRQFTGIAYSGNALNHWFWDRVVFDLASTSFAPKIPALIDHDRSRRAGVASLSIDGGDWWPVAVCLATIMAAKWQHGCR